MIKVEITNGINAKVNQGITIKTMIGIEIKAEMKGEVVVVAEEAIKIVNKITTMVLPLNSNSNLNMVVDNLNMVVIVEEEDIITLIIITTIMVHNKMVEDIQTIKVREMTGILLKNLNLHKPKRIENLYLLLLSLKKVKNLKKENLLLQIKL